MAATQTDKQQNDVRNEKSQLEQHLCVRNSLLPNGTDKTCVRGGSNVVFTKSKVTGCMSQYHQDSDGEQGLSESEMGPASNEASLYSPTSETPPEGAPVSDGHAYSFSFGNKDILNNSDGNLHGFVPRQSFGNSKQSPTTFPQQRFLSGQTLSQTTGPTPTLNQLLQSSNPMHRYQNSYGQSDQPYGQGWTSQKQVSYSCTTSPGFTQSGPIYRNNQSTIPTTYSSASPSSPGYGESRTSWPVQSVVHHGPSSPGPPSTTTPSQSSPQPQSLSPGPVLPPSPNSQHQVLQTHQNYPPRPPSSTTPNAHAPDPADLSGGNSNDSSGGPAPGTPNSQGMRPTPSPTGSTGSRSMSPAVGQQSIPISPRSSSSQSDSGGPTRLSHSPITTQSNYTPTHIHTYKGQPSMISSAQQQMPLYQSNQQYTQGGYPPRPQSNIQYPSQTYNPQVIQTSPNSTISNQQYHNRPTSNHISNSQFPPYTQSWSGPTATPGNHLPGGKGNNSQQASNTPSVPQRPHYLKQHLQHKMGFGNTTPSITPSPSPPQNYHMGPPIASHHSGMGPPSSMGPPNMSAATNPLLQNSHLHDGPMLSPNSTPNSHHSLSSDIIDNGITTMATGTLTTHVIASSGGSVTSVITTGPDGTPLDEGSQQSTLSNASATSGEDPQCATPKSRKNDISHYGHPTTPQSTVPSPGAGSMNSMHEEYGDLGSPSWPRTPASPKTDSLSKLYEMDDNPDRRAWLDKLLGFMEERRTPITTCPTISKNPLDLFRLYVFVKDRGGFMEVTKNKTWKDIAGMLGIGASSSAAYTLRKHYTKNLLAYECQFDRGGIDPQPIINQVEASSKKKGSKSASVPSPGSSNSQDSFPTPGSGGASLDGYGGYGYPSGGNSDYNSPQRPSSQTNGPSPHGGSAPVNHLGNTSSGSPSPAGGVSDNVNVSNPFDDISPSPPPRGGGSFTGHPPYPAGSGSGTSADQYSTYPAGSSYPPTSSSGYSSYSSESTQSPSSPNSSQTSSSANQDSFNRYNSSSTSGTGYPSRVTFGNTDGTTTTTTTSLAAGSCSSQQEYYHNDQNFTNQQNSSNSSAYPGATTNKNPSPTPQPRRHPDFANKDTQQNYSQFVQQRPQAYGGWPNNNQFRGQLPSSTNSTSTTTSTTQQQWNHDSRPNGQWDCFPSSSSNFQPSQQGQQQWTSIPAPGVSQSSPLRPLGSRSGKPFGIVQQACKSASQLQAVGSSITTSQLPKREITFPPDSIEVTLPVLYRRKRLCRNDIGPVDPWKILMSLKSGLLTESCYALDILTVLLFDDSSVAYFGLNQWPGLLELVLEYFLKSLADIFDDSSSIFQDEGIAEVDLGIVTNPVDPDANVVVLNNTINYSHITRKEYPVTILENSDDVFVQDDQRDWDVRGDSNKYNVMMTDVTLSPWQHTGDHIVTTFQAEFSQISFYRTLNNVKLEYFSSCVEESKPHRTTPPIDHLPDELPLEDVLSPKSSDRKHRTETLSDVISRIKKSNVDEDDVLAVEIEEQINTELVSATTNYIQQSDLDLNIVLREECRNGLMRDPSFILKRRHTNDYEDEAYTRDEASLVLLSETQDNIGRRCVCISNVLRGLTFIPGNEIEFAHNQTFLCITGKLLLLHHDHPMRTQKIRNYDREEDADFADSCSSLQGESEWWWDFLIQLRENMLVAISNIAGYIDLGKYEEEIVRPFLDGLLHWAICPSAHGQDPFTSAGPSSLLSPQRLALEALGKLCVTNNNADLVVATPPFSRLIRLCSVLTKHLCRSEDQVLREFSINLLHYLAAADSSMSRVIALQLPCISLLVAFIEQAEQSALGVANQHGIGALRDNPDSMGTSLDMLRRAAATLVFLARHPENKPLLIQQEPRLLALVMSQILDQQVALLLSKVLFQISHS